jgi:hypothetical protein
MPSITESKDNLYSQYQEIPPMNSRSEILGIIVLVMIFLLVAGCTTTSQKSVDYGPVANMMTQAGKNFKAIDLTVFDEQAVTDMRSNISQSTAYLAAADALLNTTDPVLEKDNASIRNIHVLIQGYREYNEAFIHLSDTLEKMLTITTSAKNYQWQAAKADLKEAISSQDSTVAHIDRARALLASVDQAAIPQQINESEKILLADYGNGATSREGLYEYIDQLRSITYMLKGMDVMIDGIELYQNGNTGQAKTKFLTAKDWIAVGQTYGGKDTDKTFNDMKTSIDDLLNKRVFTSQQTVVEQIYIEDPAHPGSFVLLHDLAQRSKT